jgi:signal recognition particle subunit SRP54
VQAAKLGGHDVVILDTAGRTHIDEPLMAEMAEIKRAPTRMKSCWWPMR